MVVTTTGFTTIAKSIGKSEGIANLRVADNLLLPLRWLRNADTSGALIRAQRWMMELGIDPARCAALGDAMPEALTVFETRAVAWVRALLLNPEVLVLDESVSALDVSVQAQVLNLLKDLQDELGLSYIFISHDLAVVRFISDEVLVMKDGNIVERGAVDQVLERPSHPYTRALVASSALVSPAAPN